MGSISILKKGKAYQNMTAQDLIPVAEQPKPKKNVSLADIQSSVQKGAPILGWLMTFTLGGLRIPCEDAEQLLADNGFEYDLYLRKPSSIDCFRQTMSNFNYTVNNTRIEQVMTPDGMKNVEAKIVHKYQLEKTKQNDNGIYYLTYRKIDPNFTKNIEAQKLARVEFDINLKQITVLYLGTDQDDLARQLFNDEYLPDDSGFGIIKDFEMRRDTYHDMHMRKVLSTIIEQMHGVKWSDNGMYFIPQTSTDQLEVLNTIIDGLKKYKTTTHRTQTLAIPLPDVEDMLGPQDSEGYRKAIADALEADLNSKLKEMTAELTATLTNDKTRQTIKTRNLRDFNDHVAELKKRTEVYESLLRDKLDTAKLLCDTAEQQIVKIVTEGKVED